VPFGLLCPLDSARAVERPRSARRGHAGAPDTGWWLREPWSRPRWVRQGGHETEPHGGHDTRTRCAKRRRSRCRCRRRWTVRREAHRAHACADERMPRGRYRVSVRPSCPQPRPARSLDLPAAPDPAPAQRAL